MTGRRRASRPPRAVASRERRVEHEGVHWRVWEAPAGTLAGGDGTHLFFESEVAVRRVRSFPIDWFDLPDDALMVISLAR